MKGNKQGKKVETKESYGTMLTNKVKVKKRRQEWKKEGW